jgi:hypothetical protein
MSHGRLRIEHGSGLREERELAAGRYLVERGTGDIALADENVSTRHAELRVDAGGVAIVDLGSRNGTIHIGNLTREEINRVCSLFGIYSARRRNGKVGVEFVRAAARLALSKWHMTRASTAGKQTVSAAFVAPLRQQLAELRLRMQRS